jgi:hypothetical protein
MKNWGSIHELEAQIARDEQRYREIEHLEEELMQNIAQKGFEAASTEGRYRSEKQTLEAAIRQNKELLAGARTQPD